MATKRNKSHHNNHGATKYSHGDSKGSHLDHKKNARCRYCVKKGHYKKECQTKENDVKSGKLKKDSPKQHVNIVNIKEDDNTFVVPLSLLESNGTWFIDSNASQHMTRQRPWFSRFKSLYGSGNVSLGDERELPIKGNGSIPFDFPHGGSLDLHDNLHVEGLRRNLISVNKLRNQKFHINFDDKADVWTISKDGMSFT